MPSKDGKQRVRPWECQCAMLPGEAKLPLIATKPRANDHVEFFGALVSFGRASFIVKEISVARWICQCWCRPWTFSRRVTGRPH